MRTASASTCNLRHDRSMPSAVASQADHKQYVLRKKPPGKVLASAHAVEREFQVLAALKDTPVPVPKALCLCQDSAVIGTPFYVMKHVKASCSYHCPASSSRSSALQSMQPKSSIHRSHVPCACMHACMHTSARACKPFSRALHWLCSIVA